MPNTNDKNQKQLNTFFHTKRKDANKGFTLVELMVTLTILGILLTLSVSGLLAWRDWSDFNRVNEYAETMFLSAQNQLSEYSANGTLQDFGARVSAAGVTNVPVDTITAEDGLPLTQDIDNIAATDKHYIWMSENKGTLVCVRADKGDYSRYLTGADTNSATAPFVFELLDSYIYDQSLLNETICIEFSLEDGQVFSVLFTDKHATDGTTEYSRFVYTSSDEDRGDVSVLDRQEAFRRTRMTGYYGVDTLSKAIKGGQKKISISNLELHNEETLYLSFGVSNANGAVASLNYDIKICDADEPDKDFLTFTLDGTKLKNYANREVQQCVVTRNRYEASNGAVVSQSLGEMSILAWLNETGEIDVLLDGADFQANTKLYADAMDIMLADGVDAEVISSSTPVSKFMTTYSFHRFGLDVDRIYCEVKAYGSAYKASPVKQSNTEAAYFEEVNVALNAEEDGNVVELLIANARHLNNIRYVADFEQSDISKYWSTYNKASNTSISYELTDDINWSEFVDAGYYFDTNSAGATALSDYKNQFVSIKQIGRKDEINGNSYTITGLSISEINNASAYLYAGAEDNQKPVGFVCTNFGSIHDLLLDQIQVYSNSDKVGGFCGVNVCAFMDDAGALYNLEIIDSSTETPSTVTGKQHVGGIVGYLQGMEDAAANADTLPTVELHDLKNEASVTGVKFVGGIVGEVRTPKNRLISIIIKDCENTGAVFARTKVGNTTVDAQKSGFIGGITGYVANMYEANDGSKNVNLIRIVDCVSAPKYSSDDVSTMLSSNLNGVYVGGIVGYNYYGKIEKCSTKTDDDAIGYVFGHSYVGGITGYNRGPANGISGDTNSINTANVIGVKYVGGITGANADVEEEQSVIETLESVATPIKDAYYEAEISNWENKGYVLATDCYAGGISGFNTGWIYNCDNNIDSSNVVPALKQRFSGDYVGGIAGYNSGIIGNTLRDKNDKSQITDTAAKDSRRKSVSSDVSGINYVGGIVGYNAETAIIEDYVVEGGYIRGSKDGCFVGGYVGFNASLDLLQESDGTAKTIEATPSSVSGGYFVGGILGGNIINTSGYTAATANIPVYSALTVPEVTDDDATETPNPGDSGAGSTGGTTETPKNQYTLTFDRLNAYLDGDGPDVISHYAIFALPKSLAIGVSNWRIEIDIPEDMTISIEQGYNHNFEIKNHKLIITPSGNNDVLYANGLGFAMRTTNSIDYFRFSNSEARLYVNGVLQAVQTATTTEQNQRNYTVTLTRTGTWQDWNTKKYISNYVYTITNISTKPVEGWGFEVQLDGRNFEVTDGWVRYEKSEDKLVIVPQHIYNNTVLPGATITGQFQIAGDTYDDVVGLAYGEIKKYEYYDATPSKPIDPPDEKPTYVNKYAINTNYVQDNSNEIVYGNAFVGGFTGYNLFINNSNAGTENGYVDTLATQMVSQINNQGSLSAQYNLVDNIKAISGLPSSLNISDVAFVIDGNSDATQTNRLNRVEGNICVGGVVGYSNDDSRLYIKNTINSTPIIANEDISGVNSKYYSYAGGIIGKVGKNTVLENCTANGMSIVSSKGDYSGAISEINEGYILNCSASALTITAKNYGAGLCGINMKNAMIKNSSVNGVSVKGQLLAGSLVAVNAGYIENPSVDNSSVVCAGAAGSVAAHNESTGIIMLVHNISDISITSTGDYVGGVVGLNEGCIITASAEDDYKITVTGTVSGHDVVGGIVGKNSVHNDDSKIGFFSNRTEVTSLSGNVGGIVGYNAKESQEVGRIADCDNYGTVTSKGTGYAGGICAVNDMKVLRCKNFGEVYAAEGKGDGIVAFNRDGATLLANTTEQQATTYIGASEDNTLTGVSIQQQAKPEIVDTYTVSTTGNLVYTFTWDVDKNYENALYDTKLLGVNKDGTLDLLGEQTNLTVNYASFEDTLDAWDYSKLKLIVIRQGSYDKETKTDLFAESGEQIFKSKISLSSVQIDSVELVKNPNGTTNKDNLVYNVSFKPLTMATEKRALSYYKIIVQKQTEQLNGTITNEVCYEQNIYLDSIDESEEIHTETIDLSQFEGEDILDISVKAIASGASETYRDSRLKDLYVLDVPERLLATQGTAICANALIDDVILAKTLNNDGIALSITDASMQAQKGNYEIAVAIFDNCEADTTYAANAGDFNPNDDLVYWNSNAIRTIASKKMPFVMNGNTLDYASITLGSNVKLSDYAGKWLKIAVRRTGDDYLNSAWSDEDADGDTINYAWIQIPTVMLEMPALADANCLSTVCEYYDGTDWTSEQTEDSVKEIEQRAVSIKDCDYADRYDLQIINDSVRKISIKKRLEGYNTVYDVYYIGYDTERITGVIGEDYDYWKYLGTFNDQNDIVSLPFVREFKVEINVLEQNSAEISDSEIAVNDLLAEESITETKTETITFEKSAYIRRTDYGFTLVLPYEWDEFSGKITARACANQDDTSYVDSDVLCVSSYFDGSKHIEDFESLDDTTSEIITQIPKATTTVEAIDLNTINVTYNMTSTSDLILAQIVVLDENANMKWTEYKRISMDYNTVDELMHGAFTIDAKEYFITEPKQTAVVRFTTIDTYGLGNWTQFYELTKDGFGNVLELQ